MERAYSLADMTVDGPVLGTDLHRPANWVDELIAMTRPGVDIEFPLRTLRGRVIPLEYDDFS